MISFFKALPKHTKSAFLSIFRHIAMSLSASSAVTVTLVLFSAFLLIAGNISLFANSIENDLSIHVVLKGDVTKQEDFDTIKTDIERIDGVKNVTFSDKDAELELYIKENGKEFEMYRGKDNPLSHAYYVRVKDANTIEAITKKVSELENVYKANYGGTGVSTLIEMLNSIRAGGVIFVAMLSVLAIFLISNTIKMTIYARNVEISIMRNVGAANWYIKVPFMIEGMIIGFMGAIIPCIITYFGYSYLFTSANGKLITSMFALQPISPFAFQVCGILIGAGMLVGIVGSFISTTKYLHWKR